MNFKKEKNELNMEVNFWDKFQLMSSLVAIQNSRKKWQQQQKNKKQNNTDRCTMCLLFINTVQC